MTDPTPLAIIADVHGNRWALEAVLDDLYRQEVNGVVNLGDSLYGPLDPAGTAELLRELDPPSVRGNQDRSLLDPSEEALGSPTHRFVTEVLSGDDLEWLSGHRPVPLDISGVLCCHGTPDRDDQYLVERVTADGVQLREPRELADSLSGIDAEVVACGHSHVPRLVGLPGEAGLILNPGSVGLPACTAKAPHPHAMEAGSPHARYAVLDRETDGWSVEHVAVPYDWESAARAADENGREDWAESLRTGRAAR